MVNSSFIKNKSFSLELFQVYNHMDHRPKCKSPYEMDYIISILQMKKCQARVFKWFVQAALLGCGDTGILILKPVLNP